MEDYSSQDDAQENYDPEQDVSISYQQCYQRPISAKHLVNQQYTQPTEMYQSPEYPGFQSQVYQQHHGIRRPLSAVNKKNFGVKGQNIRGNIISNGQHSSVDTPLIDLGKHRPRILNKQKEELFDETISLKMSNNMIQEENKKLRTKVLVQDQDLLKKDKMIENLLQLQHNEQNMLPQRISKLRGLEGHLTISLKKQLKDSRQALVLKDEELGKLKKNIKSTKLNEMEVEMKMYVDECTRLRHLLEEVIRSKDPLSDPNELANIEKTFKEQNIAINVMKQQNDELVVSYQGKDEETRYWRNLASEYEKKINKQKGTANKVKKNIKDKEYQIRQMRVDIKQQNETVNKLQSTQQTNNTKELEGLKYQNSQISAELNRLRLEAKESKNKEKKEIQKKKDIQKKDKSPKKDIKQKKEYIQSVKDSQKKEVQKKESPKIEQIKQESPKKELPQKESPRREQPKQSPKRELIKQESPKKELPIQESPIRESPKEQKKESPIIKSLESDEVINKEQLKQSVDTPSPRVETIDQTTSNQQMTQIVPESAVKDLLVELRLILMENNVEQDDMIEFILPDDGKYTVEELTIAILNACQRQQGNPFTQQEVLLTARFIIESRESPMIEVCDSRCQSRDMIYTSMNNAIKDYTIVDRSEQG